jgi:hypothetical protein
MNAGPGDKKTDGEEEAALDDVKRPQQEIQLINLL